MFACEHLLFEQLGALALAVIYLDWIGSIGLELLELQWFNLIKQ